MKKPRRSQGNIRSIISLTIGVGLIIAALFLWLNKQYVLDWVTYRQYAPTAEIAAITSRTTMTSDGKFYFYASQPQLDNAKQFNLSCERKEAGSAILGCYANNRIYVYDINNDQLDGIKEVTAAHEMLHAVYQRMGSDEKDRVNALLDKEYEKVKDLPEFVERMEFYAKHEAGEHHNELHSIIGTEVADISDELEAHYKTYFSSRAAVVALHDSYANVFAELKQKSEQLLTELKALGPKLEQDSKNYNTAAKQLQSDIQAFNQKATNGGFSSQAASFASERARLVARNEALDAERLAYNQNVARYEELRKEYNSIAASSQELYESLDSKLSPSPSI